MTAQIIMWYNIKCRNETDKKRSLIPMTIAKLIKQKNVKNALKNMSANEIKMLAMFADDRVFFKDEKGRKKVLMWFKDETLELTIPNS